MDVDVTEAGVLKSVVENVSGLLRGTEGRTSIKTGGRHAMNARRKVSKAGEGKKKNISSSALARKASAVTREKKKEAITAALQNAQRKGASESPSGISAALARTVEAAKLRRKKLTIAEAMEESQRVVGTSTRPRLSEALERTVFAAGRLRKKEEITAALEESQRRSTSRGG